MKGYLTLFWFSPEASYVLDVGDYAKLRTFSINLNSRVGSAPLEVRQENELQPTGWEYYPGTVSYPFVSREEFEKLCGFSLDNYMRT